MKQLIETAWYEKRTPGGVGGQWRKPLPTRLIKLSNFKMSSIGGLLLLLSTYGGQEQVGIAFYQAFAPTVHLQHHNHPHSLNKSLINDFFSRP